MSYTPPASTIFNHLYRLVQLSENDGFDKVKFDLTNLYAHCRKHMEEDSACFLSSLILSTYIGSKGGTLNYDNIYLKDYEVSQIQLFDILIDKLPYVKYSQSIVNREIVHLLAQHEEATLLDVGVGLGTQVCNILAQTAHFTHVKKLVIVGIEPSPEALAKAEAAIMAMQPQMPFTIEFRPIVGFAEHMDLRAINYGTPNIIVNASLALHHIQTNALRNKVIAQIKDINPLAFFLIEPNVNHFEPNFLQRLENAFNHFFSLFLTIDGLDISPNEKSGLKQFFGREIEDIIGKPEDNRFEKHEPAQQWLDRLHSSGYDIKSHLLKPPVSHEAGVEIRQHPEGFLGFTFNLETVLSVIYAA